MLDSVLSFVELLPLAIAESVGRGELARKPEQSSVMESVQSVAEYDLAMSSKLAITYAGTLEVIFRSLADTTVSRALDLACGPGHFTMLVAQHLNCESVCGLDLSPAMIEAASRNSELHPGDRAVEFREGDATNVSDFQSHEFDLVTFTDAAHHMPRIEIVTKVLREMERVSKPSGIVVLMDLVRLRTAKLTERYVDIIGRDYRRRGLHSFFSDFRNSMYAAWTANELAGSIPADSVRRWYHLVPLGLPTSQFLVGIPSDRGELFVRRGFPWNIDTHPVPQELRGEWRLFRRSLMLGRHKNIVARHG